MKVCILGDSLISLTVAKTLVNEGIFVDLIYDHNTKIINKTRTIGITKTNIDFFNKNILDISKLSWEIDSIEIFLEKFKKKRILNFDNNKEYLLSIIKNHKLYEMLNNCLKKEKFFKRKKSLPNNFLDNNDYRIIINCDHKSSLTKKFFYKKIDKNYESKAYVTMIKHKKINQNNIAYQIFTDLGPIAFLPVSDVETSIVYSIKKNIKRFKKIEIVDLVKKYNPKYSIVKIENIENFHLISSNLRSYYHKNILAFGDLLHRIHPLAGQGFNMSIRDIKQLLEIIKNRTSLGLDIDSSVCLDFERKLKHKNYLFSSGIDFIYEFFNLESGMKNNKLGRAVEFFGKNKSLKNFVTKFANDGL
jgi:2-octaprenyl-6-methoxyphenol hydroxylase